MIKYIILCCFIIFINNKNIYSQKNYFEYYYTLNKADSVYFLNNNHKEALFIYKTLYSKFDFVWIEDCLKIAQLSLINNDEKLAFTSLQKAICNGFELNIVNQLNLGCSCNNFADSKNKNTLLLHFIEKNKKVLEDYYKKNRSYYLKNINVEVLKKIIKLHVLDELYKVNFIDVEKNDRKNLNEQWKKQLQKSFYLIDSLFKNNIFIGDVNLGRYTVNLANDLNLQNYSIETLVQSYYRIYQLKGERRIPTYTENSFFQSTPLFIMYHHGGKEMVDVLTKYKDDLIKGGYTHPREYLYLKSLYYNNINPYLEPKNFKRHDNADDANDLRKNNYLPSIEIDRLKHEYAHKNNIQLFFGFFNSTR